MGPLFKNALVRRQFPPVDALITTLILLVNLNGSACAQSPSEQGCVASPEASQLLTPAPVSRNLKAKETHVYHVTLSPEQYVHVVVNQNGIDVVVKLFDPNNTLLIQRDSPNSQFGPEKISTLAQVGGNYYVVVCGAENEPGGTYQVKLDGPGDKTTADDRRLLAEQAYYRASLQQEQGKATALEAAISYYQEAANIWREAGDVNEAGYAFTNIGDLYRSLRQFEESESNLETALTLLREAGDKSGQAYALNSLGATYRDLGPEPRKGIARYNEALTLRRSIGDRWGEAQLLNNIGQIHERLGEREESLTNLKLAHAIWVELKAHNQAMNTLNNIATTNLHIGNLTEAFDQFQQVLEFCRQESSPCRRLEPYVRNSLGVIYDTWAEPSKAIAEYNHALTLFPQLKEDTRPYQATALDNLGLVLIGVEDRAAALEKFGESLKLRVEVKSPGEECATRSNLGFLHILLNNLDEAFIQLEQALVLSRKTNARYEGYTLTRLGFAYFRKGNNEKALAHYGQALEVQTRIGDVRGQAITLHYIAELYNSTSIEQDGNARLYYRRAQDQWKKVGDLLGESVSLYSLAKLERKQKKLPDARDAIVESIAKVEKVRTRMSNYYLRQTFFDARHDYYELEADIRMQFFQALQKKKKSLLAKHEMERALFAAERARSRNLLDLLNETQADIRADVDPQLLKQELTQRRQISEKLDQLQKLVMEPAKAAEKIKVQQELESLNRRFDDTRAAIRDGSRRYADLTHPQPLKPAQIQELLDGETCLLQYMVGEERSYLWFVTRNDIRAYTLPGEKDIRNAVDALIDVIRVYEPLQSSDENKAKRLAELMEAPVAYPKRVLALSNLVLKPITSRMGFKRIIIVADGPLQYVPFGVLTVPNDANARAAAAGQNPTPLMTNHDVIYEPSASVLALIRRDQRRTASKTVAVIADPVFDKGDERVQARSKPDAQANTISKEDTKYLRIFRDAGDIGSVGGSRLVRLRYSRKEAEAIVSVAGSESSMVALDFDASRPKALSADLQHFKYIHLATHGIIDATEPDLSGLVFSLVDKQGEPASGFLRLSDIYNLKLPAELVVLSACQSALGEEIKSEGLNGLTRGFMYAGAARVVASLWKVDDEATAELMKRFYTYMIEKNMPPSKALRQAQLDMPTIREMWGPSFYWAGFVLQGEWN